MAKAAQRVGRFQIAYEELSPAHKAKARDALVEAVAQIQQALVRCCVGGASSASSRLLDDQFSGDLDV